MSTFLTGLPRVMAAAGVRHRTVPGWETRGLGGRPIQQVRAVVVHTTETRSSTFKAAQARGTYAPTLPWVTTTGGAGYPSYNVLIGRDGTVHIVAAGVAAHAGRGSGYGMPTDQANHYSIGVSMDANGQDWPPTTVQLDACARVIAALQRDWAGTGGLPVVMHGEWNPASRSDPTGVPGGWPALRQAIARGSWVQGTPAPKPTTPASPTPNPGAGTYVMRLGDTLWSVHRATGVAVADLAAWNAISDPAQIPAGTVLRLTAPQVSIASLAQQVIDGKWGVGEDRKRRLTKAGHDAAAVQAAVNARLAAPVPRLTHAQIVQQVIDGKWGNGSDRRRRLTAAGYDYAAIQATINRRLA